jgi:hypothetical protein
MKAISLAISASLLTVLAFASSPLASIVPEATNITDIAETAIRLNRSMVLGTESRKNSLRNVVNGLARTSERWV